MEKSSKNIRYKIVKFHQMNSFSPLFSKDFSNKNTNKIFLPGCSLTSYNPEVVINTYNYLKENIDNLSISFQCCGKPTLSIGEKTKFKKYYSKLEEIIEKNQIEEIIVACPNCFSTIKNNSKSVKVTNIWDVIEKYNIPHNLINNYKDLNKQFTLHDPCPIRHENKTHDNVRSVLKKLGINILEFEKNKKNSQCCGAGGMLRVTNPKLALQQTKRRTNDAKTDTIISYCQSCCESMMIGDKNTLHILDFMFNEDVINKNKLTQEKISTIKKWNNRYKAIKLIAKNKVD